jgi:hypothetical protein
MPYRGLSETVPIRPCSVSVTIVWMRTSILLILMAFLVFAELSDSPVFELFLDEDGG